MLRAVERVIGRFGGVGDQVREAALTCKGKHKFVQDGFLRGRNRSLTLGTVLERYYHLLVRPWINAE